MTKVGRNHPCPCGSGKKYKQCCLDADEAARIAALPKPTLQAAGKASFGNWSQIDRLDHLSNGSLDLIKAGRLDEAERMCDQLLAEFPDVFDGHMRLGELHRRRGNNRKAAEHLRLAAAMARSPDYDVELANGLDAEADELDPPPAA
ncbi:MAG TPA: tetratricopeptide repeat protein [Kofleriaceae bacterium]|jgi:tetratricopeptide (TPR) repeat protein